MKPVLFVIGLATVAYVAFVAFTGTPSFEQIGAGIIGAVLTIGGYK